MRLKGLLVIVGNPGSGVSNFGREFDFSDVISLDESSKNKRSDHIDFRIIKMTKK